MPDDKETQIVKALGRLKEYRFDDDAWRVIYPWIWPKLVTRTFAAVRGRRDLAEEAAQEALFRIVRLCPFEDLQVPARFSAYATTVARHVAFEHFRRFVRQAPAESRDQEALYESDIDAKDQLAEIMQRIAHLQPEEIDLLRFMISGLSVQKIADNLGVSPAALRKRIHRVRAKLAKMID